MWSERMGSRVGTNGPVGFKAEEARCWVRAGGS